MDCNRHGQHDHIFTPVRTPAHRHCSTPLNALPNERTASSYRHVAQLSRHACITSSYQLSVYRRLLHSTWHRKLRGKKCLITEGNCIFSWTMWGKLIVLSVRDGHSRRKDRNQ
jgi:hypothetical protein